MRSEYRSQIGEKFSKKIEAIVRKAPRGIKETEDAYQDETQKCPICDFDLPIMELSCTQCKTTLPMCVATVIYNRFYFSKKKEIEKLYFFLFCRVNMFPKII